MIKILVRVVLLCPVLLATYPAAAFLCALIPVNRGYAQPAQGQIVWLCSNGVHTDLVLPSRDPSTDWLAILPAGVFPVKPKPGDALGFGWGDRGFYLNTPYWSDLDLAIAWRALAGGDATVVHIEAWARPDRDPACHPFRIDSRTLAGLAIYVRQSMADDGGGRPITIPGAGYGPEDGFVVANGHYSLFFTCNDWVRRGLAQAGVRTALWSPFPFGILWQAAWTHSRGV